MFYSYYKYSFYNSLDSLVMKKHFCLNNYCFDRFSIQTPADKTFEKSISFLQANMM